ncbi:hypothetical protein HPB52_019162 [Rhipicephalus sanguineus]|uniref:Uncharacterized protein n=1 Tax=Rhipicephalus sanguineus TaxID=34632 RepID=A0A9D4TBA7_RHISA|nr:hypothetical protein HPB52_019162 [Rhipicephalus sanguineus]
MWSVALSSLRARLPKVRHAPTQAVKTSGDVRLPDYVKKTLNLGPKFATEPKKSAPELISIARRVARAAPNSDEDSLVNECVSVVSRKRPASNHQPVRRVQQFLRDNSLCLLPADKDGGFVVLTGVRHMGASAILCIEPPPMEGALDAVTHHTAHHSKVSAQVRAVGVQHVCHPVLGTKGDKV